MAVVCGSDCLELGYHSLTLGTDCLWNGNIFLIKPLNRVEVSYCYVTLIGQLDVVSTPNLNSEQSLSTILLSTDKLLQTTQIDLSYIGLK